uniref:Uncharacterized protein n=1 Tax=Candidatus Methanogaster sp. ANME-2c ERB4 TaxID=2759911 RepID=A0A7G9YCQ1_9EURY|nr:hypothetical protein HJDPDKJO_00009 [Methanosarcinales archaeon ANME-2c ERB4]
MNFTNLNMVFATLAPPQNKQLPTIWIAMSFRYDSIAFLIDCCLLWVSPLAKRV